MTHHNAFCARVIDVAESGVTLVAQRGSLTLDWPSDIAPPVMGGVYHVVENQNAVDAVGQGAIRILGKLAQPEGEIDWTSSDALRWLKPASNGNSRMDVLRKRHVIKRALRDYLHEQDFIEIDMPLLVRGTTPDAEIDSFAVQDRYLVTSCEYQIKRMEIGGFQRLYTLTQNFRAGDHGKYRNPEFTMLEWARIGQSLADIESDAEQFIYRAHRALGGDGMLSYQGRTVDITPPWTRMTVREAIEKHIGVSVADFSAASLSAVAGAAGIALQEEWRDDALFLFSLVLETLQTRLGHDKPVFLQEWPVLMTASADLDASGLFTKRSELFIAGIELSDGFPTLTDAARQATGFDQQVARRLHENRQAVAIDTRFMQAVHEGLPVGAGMALGFDRMVMLLTDVPSIHETLAFAWDEL